MKEYGKCVVCGDDIGPYVGAQSDNLCKHCADKHGLPVSEVIALPVMRMRTSSGGWERVWTPSEIRASRQWQDEIDERLDKETK